MTVVLYLLGHAALSASNGWDCHNWLVLSAGSSGLVGGFKDREHKDPKVAELATFAVQQVPLHALAICHNDWPRYAQV